jgi:hypothetical protein
VFDVLSLRIDMGYCQLFRIVLENFYIFNFFQFGYNVIEQVVDVIQV